MTVDDRTVGRVARLLRRRQAMRQVDLAQKVDLSQGEISLIETGQVARTSLRTLRRVFGALDADVVITIRWRGGIIDRLLDERHAELVGAVATTLARFGWEIDPEVSYSIYGERGSIDLVAWHASSRTLLIVEIKTELVSVEATLRKLDEKARLGPRIVAERHGWRPTAVARLLVLPSDRTVRRHVARHAAVLEPALPMRGTAVRAWLRRPVGSLSGILFMTATNAGSGNIAVDTGRRVRTRRRVAA